MFIGMNKFKGMDKDSCISEIVEELEEYEGECFWKLCPSCYAEGKDTLINTESNDNCRKCNNCLDKYCVNCCVARGYDDYYYTCDICEADFLEGNLEGPDCEDYDYLEDFDSFKLEPK